MEVVMDKKHIADSRVEQLHVVMPQHLNGANTLFGGQLAQWIDEVAGVVAKRHSRGSITTAAIENLRFREPVRQNDLVVLNGYVTCVGRTSMEVRVDSFAEDLTGLRRLVNTAFVILVALDEHNKPREVPGLILTNEEEEKAFAAGERRKEMRKKHNDEELYN